MSDEIGKYGLERLRSLSPEERLLLGHRLQTLRINRGLTQAETARRAGVSAKTLYHLERGEPVRADSVLRICRGLETWPSGLLQDLEQERPPERPFLLHRAADAEWHAPEDRRRAVPEDNAARLRDPAERRRLGGLGFVDCFVSNPNLVMPEGPGTLYFELHRRSEGDINALLFRDSKILCVAGHIRLDIGGDAVELGPGDMVGYRSADLRWGEPARPLGPDEPPPRILWIGAVRVGKVVKPRGRTVVRRRKEA